jgi:hypothetical protein
MKPIHYLLYLLLITTISCKRRVKQVVLPQFDTTTTIVATDTSIVSTPPTKPPGKSSYHTSKDTLVITERGDTVSYSKEEFNSIVDAHPELYSDEVRDPDLIYYNSPTDIRFASEAGQDGYYELYARFLKKRNGIQRYAERRKKLIAIYENINGIYGELQQGGTYFGHQYYRISGYAEYSVYLYKISENNLEKTYDISKQKSLYIRSLRQLIEDEISPFAKPGLKKEMNSWVNDIDKAITDNFYLRRAQEFQYSHYQYY